jgi:tight adherence protein C
MLIVIFFVGGFCLLASAGVLLFYRDDVVDRLAAITGSSAGYERGFWSRLRGRKSGSFEQIIKPFQNVLPRTTEESSVIQLRLIRAGFRQPSNVNLFYGAKVVVPLSLATAATVTGAYQAGPFFIYAVTLGIGFLLPDFWLGNRINARQEKLRLGLPEALDLMVVCSEAGMGLDQSVKKVADELRRSQPEISEELSLVVLEQKAGKPRAEAFKSMAERCDVDSIRMMASTMVQSDTFGTSIGKTLRVYSDTLRTQRRQSAEEQAAKTTVKLVFPLVLFIFPSLFVVAVGPAVITMYEGFVKYLLD